MGAIGPRVRSGPALMLALVLVMSGCSTNDSAPERDAAAPAEASDRTPAPSASTPPSASAESPAASGSVSGEVPTQGAAETTAPAETKVPAENSTDTQEESQSETREAEPRPLDGSPRRALLSLPRIGIRDLAVIPYRGHPDDAPGTRIQDRGVAASPHGPRGGTGAGGVGNYIVTAHRTSSTQAFADLPLLRRGDRVRVVAGGTRLVYEIVKTRSTSFRKPQSLARQAAAVPGRPGVRPTHAMITLSTCATPEDHAVGNYWSDEFGNPEHRIDKVGVLVRTVPTSSR